MDCAVRSSPRGGGGRIFPGSAEVTGQMLAGIGGDVTPGFFRPGVVGTPDHEFRVIRGTP